MRTDKLLLDTHVFLWWRDGARNMAPRARSLIAEAELVFVSAASAWEASIKVALGKLVLPESFAAGVEHSGFARLPIDFTHAEAVTALPPHHRDPFDRILVAQAQIERLCLVTRDPKLEAYDVDLIRA